MRFPGHTITDKQVQWNGVFTTANRKRARCANTEFSASVCIDWVLYRIYPIDCVDTRVARSTLLEGDTCVRNRNSVVQVWDYVVHMNIQITCPFSHLCTRGVYQVTLPTVSKQPYALSIRRIIHRLEDPYEARPTQIYMLQNEALKDTWTSIQLEYRIDEATNIHEKCFKRYKVCFLILWTWSCCISP
jgi:hypothetical protein